MSNLLKSESKVFKPFKYPWCFEAYKTHEKIAKTQYIVKIMPGISNKKNRGVKNTYISNKVGIAKNSFPKPCPSASCQLSFLPSIQAFVSKATEIGATIENKVNMLIFNTR